MKKDNVVQFVCFNTSLDLEDFVTRWGLYAKQLKVQSGIILQESAAVKMRSKHRYISQHEGEANDFRFAFMKGRSQDHFPEQKAKVINAGGYLAVQFDCQRSEVTDDVKVIAFLDRDETDLAYYREQDCRHLNVYIAYYESCSYSYVLEYFLHETDAQLLVEKLNKMPRTEAAIYKECTVEKEAALRQRV